jgi:hypothetical protein
VKVNQTIDEMKGDVSSAVEVRSANDALGALRSGTLEGAIALTVEGS